MPNGFPYLRVAVLVAAVLAWSQGAYAATEVETTTWLWLPRWVWAWANLVVFYGLLVRFLGPFLRNFLATRREGIQNDLARARSQTSEASDFRSSLGEKLDELRADMDRLVKRSEEEGDRERKQILEQAERDRERFLEQTSAEIENRVAQARVELGQLTTRLAVDLARDQVAEQLTREDRRRLFDQELEHLQETAS